MSGNFDSGYMNTASNVDVNAVNMVAYNSGDVDTTTGVVRYDSASAQYYNCGLSRIFTDKETVTRDNVLEIIEKALPIYEANRAKIVKLNDYYNGKHAVLSRINETTAVNEKVVANILSSCANNIVAMTWGNPLSYVCDNLSYAEDMQTISNSLTYEGDHDTNISVGFDLVISGVGYLCTMPANGRTDSFPDTSLILSRLDPENTFCVRSSQIGNPVVLTVIVNRNLNNDTNIVGYTAFTDNSKFQIRKADSGEYEVIETPNPMPRNPISCFESDDRLVSPVARMCSLQDAFNTVMSDSVNSVVQQVRTLLVFLNAEIDADVAKEMRQNGMVALFSKNGVAADAKFVSSALDNTVVELRNMICDMFTLVSGSPSQQGSSGGSTEDTGKAVIFRNGYMTANFNSQLREVRFSKEKQKQLDNVLYCLRAENKISTAIKSSDIRIIFDRNKLESMYDQSQIINNLNNVGLDPVDIMSATKIFNNPIEVSNRMRLYRYLKHAEETGNYEMLEGVANEFSDKEKIIVDAMVAYGKKVKAENAKKEVVANGNGGNETNSGQKTKEN